MLRYEFVRCMKIRSQLAERINGRIFVGKNGDNVTINIFGCPTCKYQVTLNNNILQNDIDKTVNDTCEDYKKFIQNEFFI